MSPALSDALTAEIDAVPSARLRTAAEALSRAYRTRAALPHALSATERAAYLAVRFPSTFAVANAVWREFARESPAANVATVLDVGAGPGTASLAAAEVLGEGTRYTQLERDAVWRDVATRLAAASGLSCSHLIGAIGGINLQSHDVVIASYALNELEPAARAAAVRTLWRYSTQALIVIEPGTPSGFDVVRGIRETVLADGGHAAAPCTHDAPCPMSTTDWCHRPERVQRTAAHRAAKQGQLGHEDEKFSYVILTRAPPRRLASARIIRKPIQARGHVHLDLCQDGAVRRTTFAKSDGPIYRAARDAKWGDAWPPYDD